MNILKVCTYLYMRIEFSQKRLYINFKKEKFSNVHTMNSMWVLYADH